MAQPVKISELDAASSAAGTDQLETNQSGTSRSITVEQISSYVAANAGIPADNITGILPVAHGGTGLALAGTSGYVLTSTGSDFVMAPIPVTTGAEISVLAYGAVADGGTTDNATAFANAIAAAEAAGEGSVVVVPAGTDFYKVNSAITIPQGVSLRVDGQIRPGASMTNLINVTADRDSFIYGVGFLVNAGSFATNAIAFNPGSPFDNRNVVTGLHIHNFVNSIRIVTGTYITVRDVFSQGATGNTVYATAGTGSMFDGLKVLGDANGLYFSASTLEGIIISNCQILTVAADAFAIKFDSGAGLFAQISNTVCQGSVIFDCSAHSSSFVNINALLVSLVGGSSATTVGVDFIGNITDVNINGLIVAVSPKAGLRIRDTASTGPQRFAIRGYRGLENGTAAGSADLILDASGGIGIGQVSVDESWFTSTGGSVVSVLEIGPGAILSSYGTNNAYLTAPTLLSARALPASGGIPYVNASGFQSYSEALDSAHLVLGGGAGATPYTVPNLNWNNGAGNLEIAGGIASTRTSGAIISDTSLATNPGYILLGGSGNVTAFGTEGSVGGVTWTGSAAYATVIGGNSADTQFVTSNTVRGGVVANTLYSTSSFQSAAPAGSTAGLWKLGEIKAGAVVLDTTRSIQVDIGGTVYNVMVST